MAEYKEPPSTERSLNQISWHLKTLVEQLTQMNAYLKQIQINSQTQANEDVNF